VGVANGLAEHATARGAVSPPDALLRFRDGRPLTSWRYDDLWKRLDDRLSWVATHGISTTGCATPRRPGSSATSATASPVPMPASLHEVATALAAMIGQPHPLAVPPWTLTSTSGPTAVDTATPPPHATGVAHLTPEGSSVSFEP
jgi:hypothetical protein